MNLLLDTHVFIWWALTPERLPTPFASACLDPSNTLFLSVASVWEVQIKVQLGKLDLHQPLESLIRSQQQQNALVLLPVQESHVFELTQLPNHHKDPFDRMMIAQTRVEGLTLLSTDAKVLLYPVQVLSGEP